MKHLCLVMSSFIDMSENNEFNVKSSNPLFIDNYESALEWVAEQNKPKENDKFYRFIYWIEFIEDFRKGAK